MEEVVEENEVKPLTAEQLEFPSPNLTSVDEEDEDADEDADEDEEDDDDEEEDDDDDVQEVVQSSSSPLIHSVSV
ncbi:hypothetical protein DVH24_018633 [Malus domestica]|uniref:Uncharacterized protein n=1 Tax=Malus domestica TaxID=3750 RepID=A0A498HIE4_MALDO|nr:hypothetical protein DVH24_018633 [Malus domestica]